jgi:hypothetical protein
LGPDGTIGSTGAGPRPAGTSSHTIVTLSRSQSQGSPVVALIRSAPVTAALALPVDASAIHNSIALSFVCRHERREASGGASREPACGGIVTAASAPSRSSSA